MRGGVVNARDKETPQGGPLSPLLSNILLDDVDEELERRGHLFCRYADDCNISVRSKRSGERVLALITLYLYQKLKLKVNETLEPKLRGWVNYLKLSRVKGVFEQLDGWIRRKLRNIIWRHLKRAFARAKALMQRGLSEKRAWQSATNGRGPWWNSGASHMNQAFPKSYFDKLGLVSLLDQLHKFQCPM